MRYVLAPAATGVLLAFEVGALLLARERKPRLVRDNGSDGRTARAPPPGKVS